MADYRYVIRRIKDFAIMGDLAATQVSFSYALNGYGEATFTVAMADPIGDPFLWTTPRRFIVCIERNGVLMWSGPIWTRTKDYFKRTITFAANEWGSIFTRYFINGTDLEYDINAYLVLETLTNIISTVLPVATPVQDYIPPPGGTPIDNAITGVFPESSHQTVFDCINQLAASEFAGFEYRWLSGYDGSGMLTWRMQVGSPLGFAKSNPARPVYEFYAPGQNGQAAATPGAAQTVIGYTVDDPDSPSYLAGFNTNGDRVATSVHVYPGTVNDPVLTAEAVTYAELNDDEIVDYLNQRLDVVCPNGEQPGIYRMQLYIPDVVPAGANAGAVGDWVKFVYQERPQDLPAATDLRLIAVTLSIDDAGVETQEVMLTNGSG